MTRRNFLKNILLTGLALITGAWTITKKSAQKFIRAAATENYPGSIKPLSNIEKVSKWSG